MSLEKPKLNVGKRWASGTAVSAGGTFPYTRGDSTSVNFYPITVSGLTFKPSYILIKNIDANDDNGITVYDARFQDVKITLVGGRLSGSPTVSNIIQTGNAYVNSNGFSLPYSYSNRSITWIAFE